MFFICRLSCNWWLFDCVITTIFNSSWKGLHSGWNSNGISKCGYQRTNNVWWVDNQYNRIFYYCKYVFIRWTNITAQYIVGSTNNPSNSWTYLFIYWELLHVHFSKKIEEEWAYLFAFQRNKAHFDCWRFPLISVQCCSW